MSKPDRFKDDLFRKLMRQDPEWPVTFYIPKFARVECPHCKKGFAYLVGPSPLEDPLPWSNDSCPYCRRVFDDAFYESIQPKFKVVIFKNYKAWEAFKQGSKKESKKKGTEEDRNDSELLRRLESSDFSDVRTPNLEEIKSGKVWEYIVNPKLPRPTSVS